jgi:hypothetical protein
MGVTLRYLVESGGVKVPLSAESAEDALWKFLMKVKERGWAGQLEAKIRVRKSRKLKEQFLYHSAFALWSTNQLTWDEACEVARIEPITGLKYSRTAGEQLMKDGLRNLPWMQRFRDRTSREKI